MPHQKFFQQFSPILFLILFVCATLSAQNPTVLFPELSGTALLTKLQTTYKPNIVLDYNQARDTMYALIDEHEDSVSCIYTGFSLALPAGDPSTGLFNNGSSNGINCEHSCPQSKGAENGNAKSDLHHLFPVKSNVNTIRSNNPFGEVNDDEATWYYKDKISYSIPGENKDAYCEYANDFFEPREASKGNIARAVFYFVTG